LLLKPQPILLASKLDDAFPARRRRDRAVDNDNWVLIVGEGLVNLAFHPLRPQRMRRPTTMILQLLRS
jgi:hypothetical protein